MCTINLVLCSTGGHIQGSMYARQSKFSANRAPALLLLLLLLLLVLWEALLQTDGCFSLELVKGNNFDSYFLFSHDYSIRTLNLELIKFTLESNLA